MFLSFISIMLLVCIPESFWDGWSHGYNVIILAYIAFIFAPAGDSLSLDRILQAAGIKTEPLPSTNNKIHQFWPILLAQWAVALMFLNAAFWKLKGANFTLDWALSDNFRNILMVQWPSLGREIPFYLQWVADHEFAYKGLALANLLMQAFPFLACVFVRKPLLRALFGFMFILEELGLGTIMGLWDLHWLPLYALFVDWDALAHYLRVKLDFLWKKFSLVILYDGDCGLCLRTIAILKSLDWLALLNYQAIDSLSPSEIPVGTTREELQRVMAVQKKQWCSD